MAQQNEPYWRQSPTLFVVTHAGADDTVDRHLPFWELGGFAAINLVAGEDQLVGPRRSRHSHRTLAAGKSGYSGPDSIERFRQVIAMAAGTPGASVITEYDTITVRAPDYAPRPGVIHCPLIPNWEPEKYLAHCFGAPIYHASRDTWGTVFAAIKGGCWPQMKRGDKEYGDRWLGVVCESLGISLLNDPGTYSMPHDAADSPIELGRSAKCFLQGGWAVHGVKTVEQLDSIVCMAGMV